MWTCLWSKASFATSWLHTGANCRMSYEPCCVIWDTIGNICLTNGNRNNCDVTIPTVLGVGFGPVCVIVIWGNRLLFQWNVFAFPIISLHWDGVGIYSIFKWSDCVINLSNCMIIVSLYHLTIDHYMGCVTCHNFLSLLDIHNIGDAIGLVIYSGTGKHFPTPLESVYQCIEILIMLTHWPLGILNEIVDM